MKRLMKKSFYKQAGWISLEVDKPLAVGGYGKGDDSKETYFQRGILSLDTLENATGFNGEQRQWTEDEENGRYFGKYSEEKWNEFLESIRDEGIIEPIVVNINSDGSMKVWEGNHRIEAARQLGLTEIPAKIFYMGGSQDDFKIA
ncbi:gp284 [Bacillus phage G]|uniref:Gp284 n=1 Tax=Bacillus phage G TaxID=2884420 RepID=G3MA25_9CAUD|nr:gp284 [Bacillus phage G]AEO93543.1 gp284 [Bacillus phage G]